MSKHKILFLPLALLVQLAAAGYNVDVIEMVHFVQVFALSATLLRLQLAFVLGGDFVLRMHHVQSVQLQQNDERVLA